MDNVTGSIYGINGSVVEVVGNNNFRMREMVRIGNAGLIGEVIGIKDEITIVQVYEETSSLKPGEKVVGAGKPMSVILGPGIIGNIFDGIQRPLLALEQSTGAFIKRGASAESLSRDKKWNVEIKVNVGDILNGGSIIAEAKETELITHKIMLPPDVSGTVMSTCENGPHTIYETIVTLRSPDGTERACNMTQEWPIRDTRPYSGKRAVDMPLITGQRIIDTFLPIAKGGRAAIPGGFGTGKTMTQHQLAKWCDADIIIYIGCGERGNEMTQVLEDFSKLEDPKSGRPLMERTVLIANTSNMPVAAREASIYTGVTIAEYYRDMGYHVAIMADSTSRWAEALREISGRLEEMPAEEGFPAYLSSRLSGFYERAGYVDNINGTEGSVTIIGAVSPQGGDFSEPVTQNTKRYVRCFWALDKDLAYARHYPAIDWISSYTEYIPELKEWYEKNVNTDFLSHREEISKILQEENDLLDIVKLIGEDVLHDEQKLILQVAKMVRLGILQQNAFHKTDTFVPLIKQYLMMDVVLYAYNKSKAIIANKIPISQIINSGIFDDIIKMKYDVGNDELQKFDVYKKRMDDLEAQLLGK